MDIITPLIAAVVAGAIAASRDAASQAVKDAYVGLKHLLMEGYKIASVSLLDKNPTSPTYKKAVEEEVKSAPTALTDERVLHKLAELQNALIAEPKANLAAWGIQADEIKIGRDAIFEYINKGGIKAGTIEVGGD